MSGLLKFITCGSVDDGKSTLIGHILYDSKLLYADQEKALVLDSKVGSRGGEIDYSLLLDGLMAEREQGITIDVAYRYFTTDKRSFIVADTPGHEEYTRNMAVGASFAQLAVVMIDAQQGVLVQTRRHSRICALMGIKHFVYAVNKMDLVDYSQERFQEIVDQIHDLAKELNLEDVVIIPVSATEGDNVTKHSDRMPWYTGKTVLGHLEDVDVTENDESSIFYVPIQRVCRPNHEFRGFQGQVESGSVAVGDEITTLPSMEKAKIKSILNGSTQVEKAVTGQAVTIQLDREVDVSRGCVLTNNENLPITKNITATILWMDDEDWTSSSDYFVKVGTKKIPGIIKSVDYKINVNTGEHEPADSLKKNEIAVCTIEFSEKIIVDEFKKNKTLGELILIDRLSHATSACGVVESVSTEGQQPYFEKDDLKSDGYIFEEFYFNLENTSLAKAGSHKKTYHVGDDVEVKGDSFEYPEYFDIISVEGKLAVQIRNRKVFDILPISQYQYMGLPVLDEGGFEIQIHSKDDYDKFVEDYKKAPEEDRSALHNKWAKFETYRKIICTDNFWMI